MAKSLFACIKESFSAFGCNKMFPTTDNACGGSASPIPTLPPNECCVPLALMFPLAVMFVNVCNELENIPLGS